MTADVVIINLPKMLGSYFPAAPAVLKGVCDYLDISSRVLDLNLDFLKICQEQKIETKDLIGILDAPNNVDPKLQDVINKLVDLWVRKILMQEPKVVAISLFSYYAQGFAHPLIRLLRTRSKALLVIGGAGIKTSINDTPVFAQDLQASNLIDHYIVDDGELPWYEFLNHTFRLNANTVFPETELPFLPNYSDYATEIYKDFANDTETKKIWVPLTGSKGCVRKCDFCEVHQHWKFQQRSAEHIEKEVRQILKTVDDPHIHFTDSLVNGSLIEFRRIVDMMRRVREEKNFTWGGQFIARESNFFPESDWKAMASGAYTRAEVGLETGSERLRYQMNKKFTNAAVDFMLEMMEKYSIQCVLLLMAGHPHETLDDFEQTVSMLEKYAHYNKNVIAGLQLGYAVAVQPGTPLYDDKKKLGIVTTKNPTIWINQNNSLLNFDERLRRRVLLSEKATDLGYKLAFDEQISLGEYYHNQKTFQNQIKILESITKKHVTQ